MLGLSLVPVSLFALLLLRDVGLLSNTMMWQSAKAAFQSLQSVFSVLSDPERRKVYDDTGCTEEVRERGRGRELVDQIS